MSCEAARISFITWPHSGQSVSIASWKAKPTALLATLLSSAMIWAELTKLKLPEKMSMPPQPPRALGKLMFARLTFFCGKRVHTLPSV